MMSIASCGNAMTSRGVVFSGQYKEDARRCVFSQSRAAAHLCVLLSLCCTAFNGLFPGDKCVLRISKAPEVAVSHTARAAAKCPSSRPSHLGSSDRSLLHTY